MSSVNTVELRWESFQAVLHTAFCCNRGTHARPGIYKSSLGEKQLRQDAGPSSPRVDNQLEMLTTEFYSTCASPWMLVCTFCTIVFLHKFLRKTALPFPPGPKGLPILGNALDIPCRSPWLTYWQWGKKYSKYFPYSVGGVHYFVWTIDTDIVHANSLGTHIVVLNSAKAVHELFEKRSSIYSDRYET
jgi:hypothetical protein